MGFKEGDSTIKSRQEGKTWLGLNYRYLSDGALRDQVDFSDQSGVISCGLVEHFLGQQVPVLQDGFGGRWIEADD